jgi:hypothetical protein
MSKINLPNSKATARGYTIPALASCDGETVEVLIRDDADLTGMVVCWDTTGKCYIELNGLFWSFDCVVEVDQW